MGLRLLTTVGSFLVFVAVGGCAKYPGDYALETPVGHLTQTKAETIANTKNSIDAIIKQLGLEEEIKIPRESFGMGGLIVEDGLVKRPFATGVIVLTKGDVEISHGYNSVVFAMGYVKISHGGGNIVVAGRDIEVSHDGNKGGGSLLISKGKVIVNHARGTYIYALDGAEVSFATSVRSINTNERKVSWGNINNRHVEPLFESEPGNL